MEQAKSMGSGFTSCRVCLQQCNPQLNCPLARSSVMQLMAEQAIDIQKEVRIRLEKSNSKYKATAGKRKKEKSLRRRRHGDDILKKRKNSCCIVQ